MPGKKFLLTMLLVLLFVWGGSLAEAATAGPLAQIIEGAKKEGTITLHLRSGFTEKAMPRLEREIKEKFGVSLKIKFAPSSSMSKNLAAALMEFKVGATPSFDLMTFSNHVLEGNEAGLFERVDWKQILTKDMNPEVVLDDPGYFGSIVYFTAHQGMMYNPQKVPPDKVPKTLKELSDPKWKGKIGLDRGPSAWTRKAFVMGKEKVFTDLRAALKNGAILGQYTDLQSRYLLGEIWMAHTITSYMKAAIDKGAPAAWQSLDYTSVNTFTLSVRKGAKAPNAAKLIALYLAGPQGAKFTYEESQAGTMYYPGNDEYDISMQDKKQGLRVFIWARDPKVIQFEKSDEYSQWEKEIDLMLETRGR